MKSKIIVIGIILILISSFFFVSACIKYNYKQIQKLTSNKNEKEVVSASTKNNYQQIQIITSNKNEKEVYYSYNDISNLLNQFSQEYPNILQYNSLGKTYRGRNIWLVKISDNVSVDEDEPGILYTGGVHGDEKQSYQVVMYTIIAIVENYTSINVNESFTMRIRNIVNNTEAYFIPMVNPDGCEAGTRKNCRPNNCLFGKTLFKGVDIHRNSGYKWELIDKHPFKYRRSAFPPFVEKINVKYPIFDLRSIIGEGCYRGPQPFSEPESQAIKSVVENHNITISIDYHSAAGVIVYGWSWDSSYPYNDEKKAFPIVNDISKITGLKVKKGLYPILGTMRDWMYAEHNVIAIVIELPTTKGDKPILQIFHGNGNILPWKNIPIIKLCKMYIEVNLYVAENAITINN